MATAANRDACREPGIPLPTALELRRRYKTQLFAQPDSASGELKHTVWDTWGFVPSGFNVVYLVFDPADSLAKAAKASSPVKPVGIPCEVLRVNRLEKQWYGVEFYTDEDWHHCPSTDLRPAK